MAAPLTRWRHVLGRRLPLDDRTGVDGGVIHHRVRGLACHRGAARPPIPKADPQRPRRPLVGYDHPHFGRWAAVTTRVHGSGRVTYVGTVPDPALARALMDWAVEVGAGTPSWRPADPTQSVQSSVNRHGETVHIIHNWAWEPSSYALPGAAVDALTGEELEAGSKLELGAWDVRVLMAI